MALEKFHYEYDKKKITVKKFGQLPFGAVRKLRKMDDTEAMFALIEEAADDNELEIIDTIPMNEVDKFMEAWMKDSNITAGES